MTPEQKRKHLSSYKWQKLSKRRIEFDGRKCQGVGCHITHNLEAHHLSYENCGTDEEFHDLITLCRSCHQREHYRLRNLNDKQLNLLEFIEKPTMTVLQADSKSIHHACALSKDKVVWSARAYVVTPSPFENLDLLA
jgi:5-methylcytosine-specific restriction endonuclease McrA